jgi:hypothetical protein
MRHKPWFYTFWGCEARFMGLVRLAKTPAKYAQELKLFDYIIIHININIILYIYPIQGGGFIGVYGV